MPVFTMIDRSTARKWHWTQLAGVDVKYSKMMDPDTIKVFREMPRTHGKKDSSHATDEYTYLIRYTHGGIRPGAGRKAGGRNKTHISNDMRRVNIGCRLPAFKVHWIKQQPGGIGRTIETAVDMLMKATPKQSQKPPG